MRESYLEKLFRQKVLAAGGMSVKVIPTQKGMPDRIAVWPGGTVHFVELKRSGDGRLHPMQEHVIGRLRARDVRVFVLYGKGEIDNYVSAVTSGMVSVHDSEEDFPIL